jgi:hypothetical protein
MASKDWQGEVSVFAFDIVGYSQRDNAGQLAIKSTTEDVLAKAGSRAADIKDRGWTAWADAGDGGYLLISGDPRQALGVLEEFVRLIDGKNSRRLPEWRIELRYALNYGPVYGDGQGDARKLVGDAINDCARLLDGMKQYRDPIGRVVASGSYRKRVLAFGQVADALFTRLRDITDKHGNSHEVWNLYKHPGYGRDAAPGDLHDPR